MRHFLFSLIGCAFIGGEMCNAQTAADVNEGCQMTQGTTTGEYTFGWWGTDGRTYFIQQSDDLVTWSYLPVIEHGAALDENDVPIMTEYGFTSTASHFFLRLRHTDVATGGNPATADFDGDRVGNMAELDQTTDPLGWTDADDDQIPDDWEVFHGLNPASNADATLDADGDGLANREEFNHNSNPHLQDTDEDGFIDGYEVTRGTDPALATSSPLINAQAQLADLDDLVQAYLDVRAANGSLEERLAAWNALQTAKDELKAELQELTTNSESATVQDEIEETDQEVDDGVEPAESTPSTAILQYKWVDSNYDNTHTIIYKHQWEWNAENETWGYVGPAGTTESDSPQPSGWSDSDGNGGGNASIQAAIEASSNPEQWLDGGETMLSAMGNYYIGEPTDGGDPMPPTIPGTIDEERTETSTMSEATDSYTKQNREFRIRRSEDGDQSVELSMDFIKTISLTGVADSYLVAQLDIPEYTTESSETVSCDAKPTTVNTSKAESLVPVVMLQPTILSDGTVGDMSVVNSARLCRWGSPRTEQGFLQNQSEFPKDDPDRLVIRLTMPHKIGAGTITAHISTTGASGTPGSSDALYNDSGADVEFTETAAGVFESKPIALVADQDDDDWSAGRAAEGAINDPTFIAWPGGKLVVRSEDLGNQDIELPIAKFSHKVKYGLVYFGNTTGANAGNAIANALVRLPEIYAPLHMQMEKEHIDAIVLDSEVQAVIGTDNFMSDSELPALIAKVDAQGFPSDSIKIVFVSKAIDVPPEGVNPVTARTLYSANPSRPDIVLIYLHNLADTPDNALLKSGVVAHESGHTLRGRGHEENGDWGDPLPSYHLMALGGGAGIITEYPHMSGKHWYLRDTDKVKGKQPYSKPVEP